MTGSDATREAERRGLRCWEDAGFMLIGPPGGRFAARASSWEECFRILNDRELAAQSEPRVLVQRGLFY